MLGQKLCKMHANYISVLVYCYILLVTLFDGAGEIFVQQQQLIKTIIISKDPTIIGLLPWSG